MMRCPHCGEPARPGQERCFACGQKIRGGRYRQHKPADARIFIFAGAALLVVVVVLLVSMLPGRKDRKTGLTPQEKRRLEQVQDSVRKANRALRETLQVRADDADVSRAAGQIDALLDRFETVKRQVISDQPTPEQQQLVRQIEAELATMRGLVTEYGGQLTQQRRRELKDEIADVQRRTNNLISKLTRARKK
ncbi:MAG: zinc ribbon domain-containing protein [candidate division WOR-3 bacterium]